MTFEELDQRAIQWNEIANWRRSLNERLATQAMLCKEEMGHEFVLNYFSCACALYSSGMKTSRENKIQFLDDFADSRFVFVEYLNLCERLDRFPLNFIVGLFCTINDDAAASSVGHNITEAYRRVIESNFSKFVKADETHDVVWAQNEADEMSALLGVTEKITIELSHGYWVFRDQNGKIRKPSTFKPVDLSDLV